MIPFIGFKVRYIDDEGYPCRHRTYFKGNVFLIAWFGREFHIYVGKVWIDP